MTAQQWYEAKFDKGSQIGIMDFDKFLTLYDVTQSDRVFLIEHLNREGLISLSRCPGWLEATGLSDLLIKALARELESK